jgi:hypothetical protein
MKKLLLLSIFIIPVLCKAQATIPQKIAFDKPVFNMHVQSKSSLQIAAIKDSILKAVPGRFVVYEDTSINKYLERRYVINTTQSKKTINDDGSISEIELWAGVNNDKIFYSISGTRQDLMLLQTNSFFKKLTLKQIDPLIWQLQ